MNLLNLINKTVKIKCVQENPTKKIKLLKINKIPSVINLRKKYLNFSIFHTFSNLDIPVLLTDDGTHEISIILNYNFFTYSDLINLICNRQMPMSYETIGNVIHLNLIEEHLPYKFLIGKVLYDKTGCTIINKLSNIESVFRFYDFEYIGGEVDFLELKNHKELLINGIIFSMHEYIINDVIHSKPICNCINPKLNIVKLEREDFDENILNELVNKYAFKNLLIKMNKLKTVLIENNVKFLIDIKNVYWCSKLQEERRNLLSIIKPGAVVCDVFCGVGPMVIPLLLKGCIVYCNDLNEKAISCLNENIKMNKISSNFYIENLDARVYLEIIGKLNIEHFILNLPEHSIDYIKYIKRGTIHCYFFSNEKEVEEHVYKKTGLKNQNIRFIRKVSPSKNVYKLTIEK